MIIEGHPIIDCRPSEWASSTGQGLLKLREEARISNLDELLLVIGYTQFIIQMDDENSFIPAFLVLNDRKNGFFDPEMAREARCRIVTRLDWERQVMELPDDVREKLNDTYIKLLANDFATENNFWDGHTAWREMRDWVESQGKERVDLGRAIKYFTKYQGLKRLNKKL